MNDRYKINMDIPGWNGDEILFKLAEIVSAVPESGNILELGALFGRTTYVLGHNKPVSANLYVIDIWPDLVFTDLDNQYFHDKKCGVKEKELIDSYAKKTLSEDSLKIDGLDYYNLWKQFTQGIPNLNSYRDYTLSHRDDFPMFDLIFHDAGHDYLSVYNDLTYWFPKLKEDGSIIIDDYESINFPDLVDAVDRFVSEKNLKKTMVTGRNIRLSRY